MSVKEHHTFSAHIRESLLVDIQDEEMVQEWFVRIISLQFLIARGILSDYQKRTKEEVISYCKKENELFPNIFPTHIEKLEKYYPIHFFTAERKSQLSHMINQQTPIEYFGAYLEDFRDHERYHTFTSTLRNSDTLVDEKNIFAATQIFTPKMVCQYMVDNTIDTKNNLYNLHSSNQRRINLNDFTIIDPCLGTGNILLVALQKLVQKYQEETTYSLVEIYKRIYNTHLYGLDIDAIAICIAKFIFVIKAFEDVPEFLHPTHYTIPHFHWIPQTKKKDFTKHKEIDQIIALFQGASLKGSLIQIPLRLNFPKEKMEIYPILKELYAPFVLLQKKYDVVLINPPYMGRKVLPKEMLEYLNYHYPYGKSELYTAFIERGIYFLKPQGILSMIMLHTWMFIRSFTSLRYHILNHYQLTSVLHLGKNTFENLNAYNALAMAFVLENQLPYTNTCFVQLSQYDTIEEKEKGFFETSNYYYHSQTKLLAMENSAFTYWMSDRAFDILKQAPKLGKISQIRQGLATGNNKAFLRMWYEVPPHEIGYYEESIDAFLRSGKKYAPYNKGGDQTRWYSTSGIVIRFDPTSYQKLLLQGNHLPSRQYYFQKGITWSLFGFNSFNVRYKEEGYVFDVSGSSLFAKEEDILYFLGFLSSSVAFYFLSLLAPTVNFQVGNIASLPILIDKQKKEEASSIVNQLIYLAKLLDKENELSWNFNPYWQQLKGMSLSSALCQYQMYIDQIQIQMEQLEQQIDSIFQDIYQIKVPPLPKVKKQKQSDKEKIKRLLSYLVGIVLGRYTEKLYKGTIDNTRFIQLEVVILEIRRLFHLMFDKTSEQEAENILGQSLENYFFNHFAKEHIKMYHYLPIYWYKKIDDKLYIGYYHTLIHQVIIDKEQGIQENYCKNQLAYPIDK
ncbi:MAG: BREX-1 system adenine-specific DNA-methyltransferase PglX [Prevotella sp.]|nr:BREX-1 system adenine-specific DNA-methyltransferase PglX [Staphylococcus sp.]MCM1350028.1 BREX-1 system adenine-specific DNA-methyltransferase PglX [Prevotella sp.]